MRRVLLTGATGALGTELLQQLRAVPGLEVVGTSRRGEGAAGVLSWDMRTEPCPVGGRWDAVIHAAASTRWTATPEEAHEHNVMTTRALGGVVGPATTLVHVSTAFVAGPAGEEPSARGIDSPAAFRNAYEWSKAVAEVEVRERWPDAVVVRPPLIIGRRTDGRIARFSGTYTLLSALTSGMAALIVGEPDVRMEIAPVDEVAAVVVSQALAPQQGSTHVVASGGDALTLGDVVGIACRELDAIRARAGVPPLSPPPFVPLERWQRFFLPLAGELLTRRQIQAIEILRAFQAYTTESIVFSPTIRVERPGDALAAAVRHWAAEHERTALRVPREWSAR